VPAGAMTTNGNCFSCALAIETTFDWPMSAAPPATAAAIAAPLSIDWICTSKPAALK
jgi:hypothetical protein